MLPHEREEYKQQMGHVWLGFGEEQISRLLATAGYGDVRIIPMPVDPDAKGPALFVAAAGRIQNAEFRIQNSEFRIQNSEGR
jgi:ArsR family transcriptional regulator